MRRRKLGSSDLTVSVLGMGCWQYGGGNYWGDQSQRDVDEVVHRALDLGIDYFDTAEAYNDGESERSLGLALKGKRGQAIIGSKVSTSNAKPEALRAHCESSLKRLQTDYIDLYMLHWPITPLSVKHFTDDESLIADPPTVQAAFETLLALQREGKIRHIGISNHGVKQMEEALATGADIAANELAYNLLSRAIEDGILPYCGRRRIGAIGYMPLQQGLLSGKFAGFGAVKPMQARSRHFHHSRGEGTRHGEEGAEAEIEAALQGIRQVADELGLHMIELSLAWVIANESIATAIVGSRNTEQLLLNARAADVVLTAGVVDRLNEITAPVLSKLGHNPDYYENRGNSRIY